MGEIPVKFTREIPVKFRGISLLKMLLLGPKFEIAFNFIEEIPLIEITFNFSREISLKCPREIPVKFQGISLSKSVSFRLILKNTQLVGFF